MTNYEFVCSSIFGVRLHIAASIQALISVNIVAVLSFDLDEIMPML